MAAALVAVAVAQGYQSMRCAFCGHRTKVQTTRGRHLTRIGEHTWLVLTAHLRAALTPPCRARYKRTILDAHLPAFWRFAGRHRSGPEFGAHVQRANFDIQSRGQSKPRRSHATPSCLTTLRKSTRTHSYAVLLFGCVFHADRKCQVLEQFWTRAFSQSDLSSHPALIADPGACEGR